jgi:drug/metabolite transporter (DMT)-like permease
MAVGLVLLFLGRDPPTRHASDPELGNVVAAFTGLAWGCTIMALRWLERGQGSAASGAVAGNFLAFLLALPLALPLGPASAGDWLAVGYLGVFQIGLAYAWLTAAMRHVGAFEAGLLLLLEPVLNPLWAFLFQGELPNPWAATGGGIIILSMLGRVLDRGGSEDAAHPK